MAAKLPALVAHVAEGVDETARNEFACISDAAFDTRPLPGGGGTSNDLLAPNLAIVHGVALDRAMLKAVARHGASIVWSPRSNLALYGRTLDVEAARALGVNVALGTDWLPSGSISMPREAACALAIDPRLSARNVWRMMTGNAARALHADGAVGALRPGLAADLILVASSGGDPYAAVARARPGDVALVVRGGRRLAGAPELMPPPLEPGCERAVLIGGTARTLCIAAETGRTYAALAQEMAERGVWPAAFEDAPPIEPPCQRR
jgi:cytosine/adenosine deaminase-related metal-dependent hydrolase